jgi:hypothetical protein
MFRCTAIVFALIATLAVAGCGGGSDSTSSSGTTVQNASVGGIWTGTESDSGLQITGLIDEQGEFHFIRSDGVQYFGTATTSSNTVTASFDGYTPLTTTWPDGSTHGKGTLTGTVQQRSSFSASDQFTTDKGLRSSGTLALTFDSVYAQRSSLANVSGNWQDPNSGDVISVTSAGAVSWQDPATGCVGNGTVSIINTNYNAYRVTFSYANCQGPEAVLNGAQFSGLGTLYTSTQFVLGSIGSAAGVTYSVVFTLNKT